MADQGEKNTFEKLVVDDRSTPQDAHGESPNDVVKSLQLVTAISADLAQLSRRMDWSSSQIDELSKQVSALRQSINQILASLPPGEAVPREERCFESPWLEKQFEDIKQEVLAQREGISGLINQPSAEVKLSPYDDIDLQFEELRNFLEKRTSHWRIQENVFYGLVLLLLIINMALLFLAESRYLKQLFPPIQFYYRCCFSQTAANSVIK